MAGMAGMAGMAKYGLEILGISLIQNLIHTDSLESAASFGIGHAHLRLEFFFRKIAKTAKLFFRYSTQFFDPTFDDESVAF